MAIECQAIRQYANNTTKSIVLEVATDFPTQAKLVGDIDEIHYFVLYDKQNHEIKTMITEGPDYTQGSISTAILNAGNEVRHTRVNGYEANKIICK